jgi:uncharacterized damage-inducible protein DinB
MPQAGWSAGPLADLWSHARRASGVLLAAFAAAGPEAMTAELPMGKGSAGATWKHLADSERWWVSQLAGGQPVTGGVMTEPLSADQLASALDASAGAIIQTLDTDLSKELVVRPSTGGEIRTSPGEAILYLALHRTHHHAQLANMLRQAGVTPPSLDYIALLPA